MKVYTYNDKVLTNSANGKWLKAPPQPTIPDHSLLAKFISGYEPHSYSPCTTTLIDESENIWLVTNTAGNNFSNVTHSDSMCDRIVEIIEYYDTNTVVNNLASITTTANLKKIGSLFVPNATDVSYMFNGQTECESGILEAYNYLSSISTITTTLDCFTNCGSNTTTGVAALAQIPVAWGGNLIAGFVMDASNAQYNNPGGYTYLYWEGPDFPNGYDGANKQCVIVNNGQAPTQDLMYATDSIAGGPTAIAKADLVTGTTTMLANSAGTASGYGKYLCIPFNSEEAARAWVANVTITIVDP